MMVTLDLVPWAQAQMWPLQRALLDRWSPTSQDYFIHLPVLLVVRVSLR